MRGAEGCHNDKHLVRYRVGNPKCVETIRSRKTKKCKRSEAAQLLASLAGQTPTAPEVAARAAAAALLQKEYTGAMFTGGMLTAPMGGEVIWLTFTLEMPGKYCTLSKDQVTKALFGPRQLTFP